MTLLMPRLLRSGSFVANLLASLGRYRSFSLSCRFAALGLASLEPCTPSEVCA
jgi:hypothetical protein